jgi:hypothetical protein
LPSAKSYPKYPRSQFEKFPKPIGYMKRHKKSKHCKLQGVRHTNGTEPLEGSNQIRRTKQNKTNKTNETKQNKTKQNKIQVGMNTRDREFDTGWNLVN